MNATLEILILQTLRGYLPHMGTSEMLFIHANRVLPRATTRTEINTALNELEGRRQVVGIPLEGDDIIRWKIAPPGQARLAENNL